MTVIDPKKYPAPRPNRFTVFMRTFVPWQIIRFILINIKMTVMISKSHGKKLK